MVKALTGGYVVTYHPNATDPDNLGESLTVDFTPPFRRVKMVPDLEKVLKVKLPEPSEFGTPVNDGIKNKQFCLLNRMPFGLLSLHLCSTRVLFS